MKSMVDGKFVTLSASQAASFTELWASPPVVPIKLSKADLWRRLSDEEAETLDAALKAAPVRLRRIFDAADYIGKNDPDFPALRDGIVAALGEERAEQVLATGGG